MWREVPIVDLSQEVAMAEPTVLLELDLEPAYNSACGKLALSSLNRLQNRPDNVANLPKFSLRLTQSAFLLSLSLPLAFSSSSHSFLSPSRKKIHTGAAILQTSIIFCGHWFSRLKRAKRRHVHKEIVSSFVDTDI